MTSPEIVMCEVCLEDTVWPMGCDHFVTCRDCFDGWECPTCKSEARDEAGE